MLGRRWTSGCGRWWVNLNWKCVKLIVITFSLVISQTLSLSMAIFKCGSLRSYPSHTNPRAIVRAQTHNQIDTCKIPWTLFQTNKHTHTHTYTHTNTHAHTHTDTYRSEYFWGTCGTHATWSCSPPAACRSGSSSKSSTALSAALHPTAGTPGLHRPLTLHSRSKPVRKDIRESTTHSNISLSLVSLRNCVK